LLDFLTSRVTKYCSEQPEDLGVSVKRLLGGGHRHSWSDRLVIRRGSLLLHRVV
jgi:hypothetical protein